MKKWIPLIAAVALISCTKKSETAPAAAYANPCEKIATEDAPDFPEAKAVSVQMLNRPGALVCLIKWAGGEFKQESLYFEDGDQHKLMTLTGKTGVPKCGAATQSLNGRIITVKAGGEPIRAVAVETDTETGGCCGKAMMRSSRVQLFNLKTKVLTAPSLSSNYCLDDKACGKGFCDPGKKIASRGTRYNFDWARCAKDEGCDRIHFSKSEVAKNKKPLAFVLKWDGGSKLTEAAF